MESRLNLHDKQPTKYHKPFDDDFQPDGLIGIPKKQSQPIAISMARSAPNESKMGSWSGSMPSYRVPTSVSASDNLSKSAPDGHILLPSNNPLAKPSYRRLSSILGQQEGFDILTEEWEQQERLEQVRSQQLNFPSPPAMNLTFFGFEEDQHQTNNHPSSSSNNQSTIPAPNKPQRDLSEDDRITMDAAYSFHTPDCDNVPIFKRSVDIDDIPKLDFDQFQAIDESGFAFDSMSNRFGETEQVGSPQLEAIDIEQKKKRALLMESLSLSGYERDSPRVQQSRSSRTHVKTERISAMDIMRSNHSPSSPISCNQAPNSPTSLVDFDTKSISGFEFQQTPHAKLQQTSPIAQLSSSFPKVKPKLKLFQSSSPVPKPNPSPTFMATTPNTMPIAAVSFSLNAATPAITINSKTTPPLPPTENELNIPSMELIFNVGDLDSVGVYTKEQRRAKIIRYRQKRDRRTYGRKVLYTCRKAFADTRPRVGGRFVKTLPTPEGAEDLPKKEKKWRGGRIRKPRKI